VRRDALADAGVAVLAQDDWDRCHAIYEALLASPWYAALGSHSTQVTALWVDGDTDIACKARPDILAADTILCDLKVCRQATPDVYLRACVSLYHPQQLAWYARGLAANGVNVRERWVLAVHPEPPHEVTAYRMTPDLCEWADKVVESRMLYYEECKVANSWPSGMGEIDVPLPEWAQAGIAGQIDEDNPILVED